MRVQFGKQLYLEMDDEGMVFRLFSNLKCSATYLGQWS